jgi:hypothetical protein
MKKQTEPKSSKSKPLNVASLAELERLSHGTPITATILIRDQPVTLTGRRLKPSETKEIKLLLEKALPPLLPPEKEGGEGRYDLRDPDYLAAAEGNRRAARALALYSAYPIFREALEKETDGPVDADRIVKFIEGRDLEDDILEILFAKVWERVASPAPYLAFS